MSKKVENADTSAPYSAALLSRFWKGVSRGEIHGLDLMFLGFPPKEWGCTAGSNLLLLCIPHGGYQAEKQYGAVIGSPRRYKAWEHPSSTLGCSTGRISDYEN